MKIIYSIHYWASWIVRLILAGLAIKIVLFQHIEDLFWIVGLLVTIGCLQLCISCMDDLFLPPKVENS